MLRIFPLTRAISAGLVTALTTGIALAADSNTGSEASGSSASTETPKPALEQIGDEAKPLLPFDVLDRNHDGVLSTTEANQSPDLMSRWEVLDTNSDGLLDRSELALIYDQPPPTAAEAPR